MQATVRGSLQASDSLSIRMFQSGVRSVVEKGAACEAENKSSAALKDSKATEEVMNVQ